MSIPSSEFLAEEDRVRETEPELLSELDSLDFHLSITLPPEERKVRLEAIERIEDMAEQDAAMDALWKEAEELQEKVEQELEDLRLREYWDQKQAEAEGRGLTYEWQGEETPMTGVRVREYSSREEVSRDRKSSRARREEWRDENSPTGYKTFEQWASKSSRRSRGASISSLTWEPSIPEVHEVNHIRGSRLVVGVPSSLSGGRTGVGISYIRALESVGILPVVLPTVQSVAEIRQQLQMVDGVLFQGGADVNPHLYGHSKAPGVYSIHEESDRFELEVLLQTIDMQIPFVAICRGMQLLNVAMGGTLLQDIPQGNHRQKAGRATPTHSIRIEESTFLHSIASSTVVEVNSFHHQAVEQLGRNLRITARSLEDHVIEGIEVDQRIHPYGVGVQFHPEEMYERSSSMSAFFYAFQYVIESLKTKEEAQVASK